MFIYAVFNYQYIFILALFIYSFMEVEERFSPCQYRYTILYKRNEETLDSLIPHHVCALQRRFGFEPGSPSSLFVAKPLT